MLFTIKILKKPQNNAKFPTKVIPTIQQLEIQGKKAIKERELRDLNKKPSTKQFN